MEDRCHKYLCVFCNAFVFGADVLRLASNLNDHNKKKHPMESSDWTGSGIIFSSHYVGPVTPNVNWEPNKRFDRGEVVVDTRRGPRKEYTEPHGTNENRHMTPDGYAVLKKLGVVW